MILFQGQLLSAFRAKGERRLFQGQKEGMSASGVLAGNGGESRCRVQAGSDAPETVYSQNRAESLVNVREERVSVKPNLRGEKKRTFRSEELG